MIEEWRKANGLSKTAFCKVCKISLDTYNKILHDDWRFRVSALFKIEKVTKIRVYQMMSPLSKEKFAIACEKQVKRKKRTTK